MESAHQDSSIIPPLESEDARVSRTRTERYLEYVRVLRKRIANESRQNGATKWALGAAIIFFLLKSLPEFGKISSGELEPKFLWVTFAYAECLVFGVYMIYTALRGRTSSTRFDYRFTVADSPRENWQNFARVAPTLFWLVLTTAVSVYANYTTTAVEKYFLIAVGGFFGVLLLVVLVITIFGITTWVSDEKTGESYPRPTALVLVKGPIQIRGDMFFGSVGFILVISGAYHLLFPNMRPGTSPYESYIMLSMSVALTLMAAQVFLSFIPQSERLHSLDRLERDIVLHEIIPVEIRRRLEAEHLGHEFSGWLDEQLKQVQQDAESVLGHVQGEQEFLEELKSLPRDLRHERAGRIRSYLGELQAAFDRFESRRKRLDGCLMGIKRRERANRDPFVLSTIESYLERIGDLTKKVTAPARRLLRKLQEDESLKA